LTIVDGPPVLLQVADSPSFIDAQNSYASFKGWVQSKICPFGTCTIEIPTYAAHPGASTLYAWVTTLPTDAQNYRDVIEKPTNYRLSSTVGTQNCAPLATAVPRTGFCANFTVSTAANGFWLYRNSSLKSDEASCLFNTLINRCPIPTSQCKSYLTQFSCLQGFLECDAQGFQVTQCSGNCLSAINVCGPWASPNVPCSEQFPDYECSNSRYLAAEPCTGDVAITTSAGGYDFGVIGSIVGPSPQGGNTGGGFNNIPPLPSPSAIPITPDQPEPPAGFSPSQDCPSPTPSPPGRTTTISTGILPTILPPPGPAPRPSSTSQLSLSVVVLVVILSMLWFAF